MHPDPVPTSAMRNGGLGAPVFMLILMPRAPSRSSATSITCSVSGRGISTAGVTSNSSPQNSCLPVRYCVGSPAARRAISAKYFSAMPPHQAALRDARRATRGRAQARASAEAPPQVCATAHSPRAIAPSLPSARSAHPHVRFCDIARFKHFRPAPSWPCISIVVSLANQAVRHSERQSKTSDSSARDRAKNLSLFLIVRRARSPAQ